MNQISKQILAYGNCGIVRFRGKAAYGKDMSPRTGTWYKADGMGKLAPHSEAPGSVPEVNHGVVYRNSVFLPGEASLDGKDRFRSTAKASAPVAAMLRASSIEESAESIVVVEPESVSNRRRVTRPAKSAAQQIR
jgi:hypothetical protein